MILVTDESNTDKSPAHEKSLNHYTIATGMESQHEFTYLGDQLYFSHNRKT
jgi:hypothetical protein